MPERHVDNPVLSLSKNLGKCNDYSERKYIASETLALEVREDERFSMIII